MTDPATPICTAEVFAAHLRGHNTATQTRPVAVKTRQDGPLTVVSALRGKTTVHAYFGADGFRGAILHPGGGEETKETRRLATVTGALGLPTPEGVAGVVPADALPAAFYTLVPRQDANIGQTVDEEYPYVGADPRRLPVHEIVDDYPGIADVTGDWTLVRVTPMGDVTVDNGEYGADGWVVADLEPHSTLLGPQAELLTAAEVTAEKRINIPGLPGSPSLVYVDAVNAWYDDRETVARVEAASEAASEALGDAGAWWAAVGACVYGEPILALAARDLIGTVEGWTWNAYNLLTGPWVAALGPIHPDDPNV